MSYHIYHSAFAFASIIDNEKIMSFFVFHFSFFIVFENGSPHHVRRFAACKNGEPAYLHRDIRV